MKKLLILFFSLSILFSISCGKIQTRQEINNIDRVIATRLQEIDKNYSDETLKALSVAIRNNVLINNNQDYSSDINEKYLKIVRITNNKTLRTENNDLIEISLNNTDDYIWQKNIRKSDILDFALKNNISLTNLSNIETISNNGKVVSLKIGDKVFDYQILSKQFNLESNQITSISSTKNDVIINGKGKSFFNFFNIEKAEQLSKNNYNYPDILNYFFNDLKIA